MTNKRKAVDNKGTAHGETPSAKKKKQATEDTQGLDDLTSEEIDVTNSLRVD